MRRLRRQIKTLLCVRWRILTVVAVLFMFVIMNYSDIVTGFDDPDRQLKSLTLTLDLPEGLQNEDIQVMLYNHQLQGQLQQQQTYQEDDLIYAERRTLIKQICHSERSSSQRVDKQSLNSMWFLFEPSVFFCPVYKAGTTLWAKILLVLHRKDPTITSPFQLYENYGLQHYLTLKSRLIEKNVTSFSYTIIDKPLKFLFVRNPYSRIFSVYVDKVLAPNPFFWKFGAEAIKKYRGFSPHLNSRCGFDVTFKEFVKLVLESKYLDKHVKPMHKICDVCSINYDVIGKLETFDQDVNYILKKSGVQGNTIKYKNFKYETKIDIILYQVIRAFLLEDEWRKCTSKHSALRRLWRQLQISGFIGKGQQYPLSTWESEHVTRTQFINLALQTFQLSTSGAKVNKKEAYLQAYSQLSNAELEGLRQLYLKDFKLFGYEDRPKELFELNKDYVKPSYDYFDMMRRG